MANSHPIALSNGELSPHRPFSWSTLTPSRFVMVIFQLIALSLMVNSHPIDFFLRINSHPIALFLIVNSPPSLFLSWSTLTPWLFLMVNSHPMAFSHGQLSPMALFIMVNSHPIAPFYGQLAPHPRWLSLPGLNVLLTASDMDPAYEASLIVLG